MAQLSSAHVIVVGNEKGGAGKSTIAIHVATALLHGLGQVSAEQIAAELPRHGVIAGELGGRRMATTAALQEEERQLVRFRSKDVGQLHHFHLHIP